MEVFVFMFVCVVPDIRWSNVIQYFSNEDLNDDYKEEEEEQQRQR